jgi:hypothetical protein
LTAPTLTYNQGFCNDFIDSTSPSATVDGQTIVPTGGYYGDYMHLNVTGSVGNQLGYVNAETAGNIGLDTTNNPYIILRYKTSDTNIKAAVVVVFSDTTTQAVLAETSAVTFKTVTVALTAAKVVDHILLYANHATGSVDYDFVMLCNIFSFPQWNRLNIQLPNFYNQTRIPSKVTNRNSFMGSDDAKVTFSGDLDSTNTSWSEVLYAYPGYALYEMQHNAYKDAFHWFTSDRAKFKVVIDNVEFTEDGSQTKFLYDYLVMAHEVSRVNKSRETYYERFGLTGVT